MTQTRSPSLVSARPMSHSKRRAARLLDQQAVSTCRLESLRAATNCMMPLLPFSEAAIASTPPGSMHRPVGCLGAPASCRTLVGLM
eukprot:scaffold81454_cov74-Phaeocystis_antarctica.AAC.2